jgi:hypothetical protein
VAVSIRIGIGADRGKIAGRRLGGNKAKLDRSSRESLPQSPEAAGTSGIWILKAGRTESLS